MSQLKITWIGGNHPRHLYFANFLHKHFPIHSAIVEKREHLLPEPPQNCEPRDRANFIRHFKERDLAEKKYFGEQSVVNCETMEVAGDSLNTESTATFLKKINPDLVIVFGSGMIRDPLYSALPRHSINLHLGLSPRYRGAATLFWPFYFMEPNYAGSTFHYIVSEPDAGDVIHQVLPTLSKEDGIHDVACKTVIESAKAAVKLASIFAEKKSWKIHRQTATGKNFLARDFKPEHLRVIYDLFSNRMVEHYLNGTELKPKIFQQFS